MPIHPHDESLAISGKPSEGLAWTAAPESACNGMLETKYQGNRFRPCGSPNMITLR
jgi:hypothetical protein